MSSLPPPARWDIVWIDFGVPIGHEQGKDRPALVVSVDGFNKATGLVTVCPFSSRSGIKYPSEVAFPSLPGILDSGGVLMVQQIRTLSQVRIRRIAGPVKDPVLQRLVAEALKVLLPY